MEIWAHQGKISPNYPGNTLADFNQAHEIGVKGIETDVCFTAPDKNGKQRPVIHHPNKDGAPPNESLPSLDSFLELLKSLPKLSCCLELKEDNEKLVSAVVDKITEYGLEGRIYLTVCQTRVPFLQLEASAKLIFKARVQNPKIKTHIIATFPFNLPALAPKYSPDIISLGWLPESKLSEWFFKTFLMKLVNLRHQIKLVQDAGTKIIGGIVNEEKDFEYFVHLNVDGIMTDNSITAMKFIETKSP